MKWFRSLFALALILPAGCTARLPDGSTNAGVVLDDQEDAEAVLCVTLDVTGSFHNLLFGSNGCASRFCDECISKFFRDKGQDGRLVLAMISGKGARAVVWDGRARDFRRDFPTTQKLKTYLQQRESPAGSAVYESMADAIDYTLSCLKGRRTKSAIIFLTDTDENTGGSEQRVVDALGAYAKAGGAVGIYWVDADKVTRWENHLRTCGFAGKRGIVRSSIRADMPVVEFEN